MEDYMKYDGRRPEPPYETNGELAPEADPTYPGLLYCRKHDDYYGVGTECKACMARKPALADFDGAEARYNALVGATDTPGVFPPYGMGRDIRVTGADPATECPDPFVGQRLQLMPKCRTDVAGQVEVLAMALDTVMRECGDKGMGHQATMEAVAQAAVDIILTPLFKKFDPGPPPDCPGAVLTLWRRHARTYRRLRKAAGMPVPPTEEED